jgi:hypothetical protein
VRDDEISTRVRYFAALDLAHAARLRRDREGVARAIGVLTALVPESERSSPNARVGPRYAAGTRPPSRRCPGPVARQPGRMARYRAPALRGGPESLLRCSVRGGGGGAGRCARMAQNHPRAGGCARFRQAPCRSETTHRVWSSRRPPPPGAARGVLVLDGDIHENGWDPLPAGLVRPAVRARTGACPGDCSARGVGDRGAWIGTPEAA